MKTGHLIDRRQFMKHAVAAVGAVAVAPVVRGAEAPLLGGDTLRTLGRTGLMPTLLGMGTGVKAWNKTSELTRKGHDAALAVLRHAYDMGIRYFDCADSYGAHGLLRELIASGADRSKLTLLTKSGSREAAAMKADIERFRQELNVDQIDIVLLHCLDNPDWPSQMGPCMEVLSEAKSKGLVRSVGVSCHEINALRAAAESPWVETLLVRINPYGVKMDGPVEEVVPIIRKARENGKGILGMKILGEGKCRDKAAESIRYVLNLGLLDAMTIGFVEPPEVDSAMDYVAQAAIPAAAS